MDRELFVKNFSDYEKEFKPNNKLRDLIIAALEKDDVQAIESLRSECNPGAIKFGRFPFLSVAYLLSAKKIAKQYENDFIKINTFVDLPEPLSLSAAFRKKAGKATRLFLEESVSPVEMLVILGDTKKATELYPIARPTVAQKDRIEKIYSLQYNSSLVYQGNEVIFDKKPLSHAQKKRILIAAISSFLCVALCACTPFVVNAFVPFIGVGTETEADRPDQTTTNPEQGNTVPEQQITDPENGNSNPEQGEVVPGNPGSGTEEPQQEEKKEVTNFVTVSSFEEVNLSAADTRYTLSENVVLPDCSDKVLECELDCAGHTLTATAFPLFGNIKGSLENVTFTASGDREINESTAFLAKNNQGVVKNVTFTLSGEWTVTAPSEEEEERSIAGLIIENNGEVDGCSVSLDVTVRGEFSANAVFAGVVSVNNKTIVSCTVTGSVEADTCDLAGICGSNNYLIKDCTNDAALTQTTSVQKWSPIVAGIACKNSGGQYNAQNSGGVLHCTNNGVLRAESTYAKAADTDPICQANCSGIVATNNTSPGVMNSGFFQTYVAVTSLAECVNNGNVSAKMLYGYAHAGGICAYSETMTKFSDCVNNASITAESDLLLAFAAGIVSFASNSNTLTVASCVNASTASIAVSVPHAESADVRAFAGGIVGFGNVSLTSCSNAAPITLSSSDGYAFIGGIAGQTNSLSSCENNGTITCSGSASIRYVGGLAGWSNSATSSANKATVTTTGTGKEVYVAGCAAIVGSAIGSTNTKKVTSDVVCENLYGGGIAGTLSGSSYNDLNEGDVVVSGATLLSSVGGIAGKATGNVNDCENKAIVTVTSAGTTYVGGILGETTNAIYICKNSADITVTANGTNYVGGTVGNSTSTLSRCVCLANVTVNGNEESLSYVGGICGQTTYMVEYSYLEGELTVTSGVAFVGGILGNYAQINYIGKIDHSITKGSIMVTVSGEKTSYVGGICGYLEEKLYYEGKENEQYFGGYVTTSYALNSVSTTGTNVYKGAIVGASGKNITMKEDETHYEGNYYTSELNAIGAYVNGEEITEGNELGGTRDLSSVITESETYKSIIKVISALLGIESEPEQEEPTAPEPETPDPEEQEEPGSGNILT